MAISTVTRGRNAQPIGVSICSFVIRAPVEGVPIAGRATQGVIVFDTAVEERVVLIDRVGEIESAEEASRRDFSPFDGEEVRMSGRARRRRC